MGGVRPGDGASQGKGGEGCGHLSSDKGMLVVLVTTVGDFSSLKVEKERDGVAGFPAKRPKCQLEVTIGYETWGFL